MFEGTQVVLLKYMIYKHKFEFIIMQLRLYDLLNR